MYDENIISRMNDYLHKAAQALASWLSVMLPKSGEDWWEECVLSNLSYPQRELIEKKGLSLQRFFVLPTSLGTRCAATPIFRPVSGSASAI